MTSHPRWKMSGPKALGLFLGLALTSLSPPSAHAADTGGNAAACKPTNQANAQDLVFNADGVVNNGSLSGQVTCGTLRINSWSPTNLWVDFYDATLTGNVFCQATVWQLYGVDALWTQTQRSVTAATGNGAFHFVLPTDTVGFVELRCTLPPSSSTGGHSILRGFNLQ